MSLRDMMEPDARDAFDRCCIMMSDPRWFPERQRILLIRKSILKTKRIDLFTRGVVNKLYYEGQRRPVLTPEQVENLGRNVLGGK